ncbi:MAG: ABC transporter ATP-binding protein [Acidobacteriia bacterium]|nr:ABC transporter ATP-binding protein [Terriglobia bacterium]
MRVLEFNDVCRAYQRGADVLRGITFALEAGEVVGLLGKNGAGKTTLIRVAIGMIEAQKGSVRVFGLDPRADALEVKRRVGYVSEDQVLPEFLSVGEVIRLHRGLFPTWDDSLERRLRERFALSPKSKIKTLSKGQARQVALLCAVAHRPELLLLDEPAGGLDPSARREFLETSIQLLNEAGTTILFSSHYMADVERMAGRIVMIHEGRLLLDNNLDDLREKFTLVMVPKVPEDWRARLRGAAGCLSVRDQGDALHAIFALEPERCRRVVEGDLGFHDAYCTPIALEDMFIELVGGRS